MWNGAALNLELFTSTDSRLYLRRWCVGVDRLNTNSSGSAAAAWAYCVIHLKPGLSGSTRYQSTVESFTTVMCVYRWWAIPPPPHHLFYLFFFFAMGSQLKRFLEKRARYSIFGMAQMEWGRGEICWTTKGGRRDAPILMFNTYLERRRKEETRRTFATPFSVRKFSFKKEKIWRTH